MNLIPDTFWLCAWIRDKTQLCWSKSFSRAHLMRGFAARAHTTHLIEFFLGWKDSNLRMAESKPAAVPLGDTPIQKFPNKTHVRAPNCGFDSMRSFGMPGTRTQNYSVKSRVVNLKKRITGSWLPALHFLDFKTVHETFVSHGSLQAKKKKQRL